MELLSFQQRFNGQQSPVPIADQMAATEYYKSLAQDTLSSFSGYLRFEAGMGVNLTLVPEQGHDSSLVQVNVRVDYNNVDQGTFVSTDMLQAGGKLSESLYNTAVDRIARRRDLPDLARYQLEWRQAFRDERATEYLELSNMTAAIERETGTNGCPVSPDEVEHLGALILGLRPIDRVRR